MASDEELELQEKDMEAYVTVSRYLLLAEAEMACTALESAGIDAVVADAEANVVMGYLGGMGGVRLQVKKKDADAARELLSEAVADEESADDDSE